MPATTAAPVLGTTRIKALVPCSLLLAGLWLAFAAGGTAQSYTFTTVAGLAGVSGTDDGTNSTARFYLAPRRMQFCVTGLQAIRECIYGGKHLATAGSWREAVREIPRAFPRKSASQNNVLFPSMLH